MAEYQCGQATARGGSAVYGAASSGNRIVPFITARRSGGWSWLEITPGWREHLSCGGHNGDRRPSVRGVFPSCPVDRLVP